MNAYHVACARMYSVSLYNRADIAVFRLPMAEWLVYSAIISTGEVRVPGGTHSLW